MTVPAAAPQPRARQIVLDLARQLWGRAFLVPVTALAAAGALIRQAGPRPRAPAAAPSRRD